MQQVIIEMSAEKERLAIQAERVRLLEIAEKEKADKIGKLEADIEWQDELLDRREQELSDMKQELDRLKREDFERDFLISDKAHFVLRAHLSLKNIKSYIFISFKGIFGADKLI